MLANVRPFDDLAHPLCRNLRDGNWLLDYVVGRLLPFVGTRQVSESNFSLQYHPEITHQGHENKENDQELKMLLIVN